MGAYNSKEEPSLEEPEAKRRRLELPLNAEQIIQNQQQLIENLRAEIASKDKRILELEVHCPDWEQSLPNECLMKIMSYLSSYDLLRNVARVSKKFHKLSQDQHLISKIEVSTENWSQLAWRSSLITQEISDGAVTKIVGYGSMRFFDGRFGWETQIVGCGYHYSRLFLSVVGFLLFSKNSTFLVQ